MSNAENYVSLADCWNIANRQAKFIVNSLRVYEFLGYEWRIPLWDSELMNFWSKVPLKYRIKKELYDEYLFERIFREYTILLTNNVNEQIKSLIKKLNLYINKG